MGRNSQPKNTNGPTNDKANPDVKWARMLNLLDYQRWHHVKKVLNKKHSEKKNGTGTPSAENVHGPPSCFKKEIVQKPPVKKEILQKPPVKKEILQKPPVKKEILQKPPVEEQTNDPGNAAKNSASPSSPRPKSSRTSKKIKKIVKEVTKKRGRHKRSNTCPVSSGFTSNEEPIHQQSEYVEDQGASDLNKKRDKSTKIHMGEGDNRSCGLNTTQKESQLGEREEAVGLPLHQLSMFLREMPCDQNNQQISNADNVARNASLQHYSRDFFDVIDVLSLNKQFFLRVLDDPDSSLRHHFLIQQSAPSTSKRKALSKFGTFPANRPSSMDEPSLPNILKHKHGSFKVYNSMTQTQSEKLSFSFDDQMAGTRFKSLRERLKHAVKETKKESRRIAMDAVFHKVPYGQNSQEESTTKSSPCVSSCESNFSSPAPSYKNGKKAFERCPSLEESMHKYCQLFQTTGSFNRSCYKMETPDRSRLKVKDENSPKKALKRNFSLPDLQVSLYQKSSDYEGCNYSRAPNSNIMSFNERRMHEGAFNMGLEFGKIMADRTGKEELEELVKNEVITIEDTSNKEFETILNALEYASCDDDNSSMTDNQFKEIMNTESDDQIDELEDIESTKDAESEDSPTFACIKVDEDQVQWLNEPISPTLQSLKVSSKDEAEFNYVKDILQISGYSGSQLLGSWFSSGQPVDPSVFVELESFSFVEPISYVSSKEGNNNSNHMLLFDLINEVLMSIYERSISYWPRQLSSCSRTHLMPKGYHVLEEVWNCINWYLACSREGLGSNLDYIVMRDLAKDEGWKNLQFDAEYVSLEVEEFIFDDLLAELVT